MRRKFDKVIGEYGRGKLHSGSKTGPKVTNPKQALAIAYSEQRRTDRKKGTGYDKAFKKRTK